MSVARSDTPMEGPARGHAESPGESPARGTVEGPDDLAAEAWGLVLALALSQRHRFLRVLQESNMTFGDFRGLDTLSRDVPRPMGALAQIWDCDASNATWIVDRLEERGLVQRSSVPGDRRVKAIVLTPKGVKTKAEIFRRLHEPPPGLRDLDPGALLTIRDGLRALADRLGTPLLGPCPGVPAAPPEPA